MKNSGHSISFCSYYSDILPSDRIHYLSLCNFFNRFVWFCQLYSDRSFIPIQSSSSSSSEGSDDENEEHTMVVRLSMLLFINVLLLDADIGYDFSYQLPNLF